MRENISVLGSTGSVGVQTLEIARELGVKVSAISGNSNLKLLENQVREFRPKLVAVFDDKNAVRLRENIKDTNTKVCSGVEGLCQVATLEDSEMVVTAVSGMIGLEPTVAAINFKKNIAVANKETLVAGGDFIMSLARDKSVKILPVDSEHSAIFQCLQGNENKSAIKKLILTASGGPFFGKSKNELKQVSIADALNHPRWNMGQKITVDSATLMNKGLEIIEAVHLFDLPENKIEVVVHPESIIHSMVEYVDNSIIAQMGTPSMKIPIQYAITYPHRQISSVQALNFSQVKNLSFFTPDTKTFEAIDLCRSAIRDGNSMPIILNSANEEAVKLFLDKKIEFIDIIAIVKESLRSIRNKKIKSVKDILDVDRETREAIRNKFKML